MVWAAVSLLRRCVRAKDPGVFNYALFSVLKGVLASVTVFKGVRASVTVFKGVLASVTVLKGVESWGERVGMTPWHFDKWLRARQVIAVAEDGQFMIDLKEGDWFAPDELTMEGSKFKGIPKVTDYTVYSMAFWYYIVYLKGVLVLYSVFKGVLIL